MLLVDDDALWRMLTCEALRQRGFEVYDLDSAVDLLAEVAAFSPNLVIVDAMMPQVDGFAACKTLRDDPKHALLPVLMVTSLEEESAISRAYESGASDFFIKSTHWALLAERVRHLIRMAEMQSELLNSHAKLVEAQSAGRVGGFEFNLDSAVMSGAPGSFLVFGLDSNLTAIPASLLSAMVDPADKAGLDNAVREAIHTRAAVAVEFGIKNAKGQLRAVRIEGVPIDGDDGRVRAISGVIRDVTEKRQAQDEIRRLASFDPLTGLLNRPRFLARCAHAIEAARLGQWELAVAAVDLDRFTSINERFGQAAGDDLLCQLARRMTEVLLGPALRQDDSGEQGPPDTPVLARMAGDDFAILLPVVRDRIDVDACLDHLHEMLRKPFLLAGAECIVSASIGVAQFPGDGDSAGLLLSRADVATSTVKAAGRNGVRRYSPALEQLGRVRLELTEALRRAIDGGELELHYQAIVDVSTGRVAGAEALMRWRKPEGLVPPSDFIPLAEETGLIIPMGEWAIREACRQLGAWQAEGVDIASIAVNLPSGHFERASLLPLVQAAMSDYALAPGSLELELTETALVRDLDRTLPRLNALRDAGALIAIDDFGTGYSSLSYLARLPLGKLKIDRSFINDMSSSPQAGAIIRAIVALASGLEMKVVAEGVETVEQARTLAALGCSLMQGFLFARPVGAHQFPAAVVSALAALRAAGSSGEAPLAGRIRRSSWAEPLK